MVKVDQGSLDWDLFLDHSPACRLIPEEVYCPGKVSPGKESAGRRSTSMASCQLMWLQTLSCSLKYCALVLLLSLDVDGLLSRLPWRASQRGGSALTLQGVFLEGD